MITYRTTYEADAQPSRKVYLLVPNAKPGERVKVVIEREGEDVLIEEIDYRAGL